MNPRTLHTELTEQHPAHLHAITIEMLCKLTEHLSQTRMVMGQQLKSLNGALLVQMDIKK